MEIFLTHEQWKIHKARDWSIAKIDLDDCEYLFEGDMDLLVGLENETETDSDKRIY